MKHKLFQSINGKAQADIFVGELNTVSIRTKKHENNDRNKKNHDFAVINKQELLKFLMNY